MVQGNRQRQAAARDRRPVLLHPAKWCGSSAIKFCGSRKSDAIERKRNTIGENPVLTVANGGTQRSRAGSEIKTLSRNHLPREEKRQERGKARGGRSTRCNRRGGAIPTKSTIGEKVRISWKMMERTVKNDKNS